ncbi:NAD-dependent deacylase [Desulfosarcina alkanivorans]|jgi:NAD-dependent deacetylase|uniref:protein acetyllysine N-acetyltransferase n=1 Tax=Desulfosarcina alkanivorans TaxID=571177 RepID=A0A5K7YPL6_9BACT|nr:NAD-dependent deacylase [Desulfosarcina alkanivorans]BBO71732.1 NAD-dependent deacylase [Desulfosarcina alkanivorans]
MPDLIERSADILARATSAVALTGAGISVESGIPPFRGKGGLWEKMDPMKVAHIDAFLEDPEGVWNLLIKDMKTVLDKARPNSGHTVLADLERLGILKTVITQNVDGLHQMAGNSDVIEFHGNFAWQRCLDCNRSIETSRVDLAQIPPRCRCGGILRPDCVFFGEMIPHEALIRSQKLSAACDVMLVIGTSAMVQPAATMPFIAKDNGAVIIEINPEPTPLTSRISNLPLLGNACSIMPRLAAAIRQRMPLPDNR